MTYLFDIALHEISDEHLLGDWAIDSRFVNKNEHEKIFLHCNNLSLRKDGMFETPDCKGLVGTWVILREVHLIYNPQLVFYREAKQIAKAIVTRLLTDNKVYKLTLYFSTGLELNLEREERLQIRNDKGLH